MKTTETQSIRYIDVESIIEIREKDRLEVGPKGSRSPGQAVDDMIRRMTDSAGSPEYRVKPKVITLNLEHYFGEED